MMMMIVKEEKMEMQTTLVNIPMMSTMSSTMSNIPSLNPNPLSTNLNPDPYNHCLDQLGGPTESPSVNSAKSPNMPKQHQLRPLKIPHTKMSTLTYSSPPMSYWITMKTTLLPMPRRWDLTMPNIGNEPWKKKLLIWND